MKTFNLFLLSALLHSSSLLAQDALPATDSGESSLSPEVVTAIRHYAETQEAPILDGHTRQYPYGLQTPVLRCAPLRVCAIRLEEGETVWEVLSGDTSQWQIHQASTGPSGKTPVVAVKPLLDPRDTCDKSTNLLITTDRRIYSVVLNLPPCASARRIDRNPQRPFDSLISFYYPQETLLRWNRKQREAQATNEHLEKSRIPLAPADLLDLNWTYVSRSKGRPRFPWKPTIFDDGTRTFLRLPEDAAEAPAVFAFNDGQLSLLNSSLIQDTIVIDRVLDRFILSLPGSKPGKNRQLLVINRQVVTDE